MYKMTEPSLSIFADDIQAVTYDLVHYYSICDRVTTQELDVTASQGYILLAIPDMGSINMNDLSVKMRVANSTMTRMVDQLVQKCMVNRTSDNQDRRIVLIHLTEHGKEVRIKLKKTIQDFFSQVLNDIPEDQRAEILHSLEILNQSILRMLKSCCGTELP
jgi:DNA-binding MarR family transcriptional regulator